MIRRMFAIVVISVFGGCVPEEEYLPQVEFEVTPGSDDRSLTVGEATNVKLSLKNLIGTASGIYQPTVDLTNIGGPIAVKLEKGDDSWARTVSVLPPKTGTMKVTCSYMASTSSSVDSYNVLAWVSVVEKGSQSVNVAEAAAPGGASAPAATTILPTPNPTPNPNPNPSPAGEPGLIAHFTFDGTFDAKGAQMTVVPHNGVRRVLGRRGGEAVEFDGIDDWIRVEHGGSLSFDPDVDRYTIAMWLFDRGTATDTNIVRDGLGDNNSYDIGTNLSRDTFLANIYNGTQNHSVELPRDNLLNSWHHVACLFGPEGLSIYVDGRLAATRERTGSSFSPSGSGVTTIGAGHYSGMTNYFHGELDDLRFYQRHLTAQEIASLANQ